MPSDIGVITDDVPPYPPPPDADDQQRPQMVAVIMDNLMGLINPDGEILIGLSRATHIARGEPV